MKTIKHLRTSWFLGAILAAILLGELAAWQLSHHFGLEANPLVVAVVCTGAVALVVSLIYDGRDD